MKIEIHPIYGLSSRNVNLISTRKKEPAWMLKKRLTAFKYYSMKNFPKNYPELSAFEPQKIKIYLEARGKPMKCPEVKRVSGYLLQSESTVQKTYLNRVSRLKHVQFSSISEGLKCHEEIFRKYFDTFQNLDDWIFSHMNLAIFTNGAFLYVPAAAKCMSPFIVSSKIFSRGLSQFKRNLFIYGEGSEGHAVIRAEAEPWDKAANLSVETTEIIVERGAAATLLIDQKWRSNVWNFHTIRCEVRENAKLEIQIENSKAAISMIDLVIYLKGEHAACSVKSISALNYNEKQEDFYRIIHENPKTLSRLDFLNCSKDNSVIRKSINVAVKPLAANSESSVNCLNMVFDPRSQIAIDNGSAVQNTTSTLNKIVQYVSLTPEQINYLKSRWMDAAHIEELMIETAKKKLIW